MHTPWLQIAHEVRTVNAPQLAGELDIGVGDAYLMLADFIGWALHRCPEDRPPSASSLVKGPSAARQIANGMGWRGDAQQLLEALLRLPYGMIEQQPGGEGIRIRGLKRYDHHWRKSYPDAARVWDANPGAHPQPRETPIGAETAPKPRRNSAETAPPDPDPDPDSKKVTTPPTPPSFETDAPPLEPPPLGEKEISGCWEAIQANRDRARLKRESQQPTKFASWYREKRAAGRSDADIAEAHRAFLASKTVRSVGHPTQVFMTEGMCEVRLDNANPESRKRNEDWLKNLQRAAARSTRDERRRGAPTAVGDVLRRAGGTDPPS